MKEKGWTSIKALFLVIQKERNIGFPHHYALCLLADRWANKADSRIDVDIAMLCLREMNRRTTDRTDFEHGCAQLSWHMAMIGKKDVLMRIYHEGFIPNISEREPREAIERVLGFPLPAKDTTTVASVGQQLDALSI